MVDRTGFVIPCLVPRICDPHPGWPQSRCAGTCLGAVVIGSLETGLGLMGINWFVQMVVKGYVILLAVALDQVKKRAV